MEELQIEQASAPETSREIHRCRHCRLVQFVTASGNCRKCRTPYLEPEQPKAPEQPEEPLRFDSAGRSVRLPRQSQFDFGFAVYTLRHVFGWSQSELACWLAAPRTWLTKIENNNVVPTLESLERLAEVFTLSPRELVCLAMIGSDDEIRGDA
jgi:ribosome-binding protein aMBF1 (putative translation factor)